jgi:hypothetical protein
LVAFFLATGCGTIVNGRFQKVPVTSDPAGAAIAVACGDVPADGGVTPATVRLRRGAPSCSITLKKAGYVDETITFQREVTGAFWANFSCASWGALASYFADASNFSTVVAYAAGSTGVCMGIDYLTGSHLAFAPQSVNVALKR